jgi:uncharacterized protein with beta-barrel porin domain
METIRVGDIGRIPRCLFAACLLLAASALEAQDACDDPSVLTTAQRNVCQATGGSNIIGKYGANATALQQMSTQSDIRLNSVAATTMSRDVQCIAAGRNGAPTAGCPNVAQVVAPAQTREVSKLIGPYGLTIIGSGGTGEQDNARDQTGFDSRLLALTGVLDYRFAENLLAGVSLGYQKTKLDLNFNSGSLDSDAYRVAVFANYAPAGNVFLQGLLGIGLLKNDSERVCSECGFPASGPGTNPTRNVAEYDSRQVLASLGGGYLFPVASWHLAGYLRADYVRTRADAYTETPTDPDTSNQLQVDAQTTTSLTSALGVQASYGTVWAGVSVTPSARLEWGHEFKDDSRTITSRFVGSTQGATSPLLLPTASPVRDWVILGLGLRASFTRALGGFVDYSHLFKSDASYDVVSVGLRYEF